MLKLIKPSATVTMRLFVNNNEVTDHSGPSAEARNLMKVAHMHLHAG